MGLAVRIEPKLDRSADERSRDVEPAAGTALEAPVQLDRLAEGRPRPPRPGAPRARESNERGGARAEPELAAREVEIRRVERRAPGRALPAERPAHQIDQLDAGLRPGLRLHAPAFREAGLEAGRPAGARTDRRPRVAVHGQHERRRAGEDRVLA